MLALDTAKLGKYGDVIDLSIGDMDVPTDRRIIEAACRDASAGYTTYGMPKGDPALIDGIHDYYDEMYGLSIPPEQIYITASSLFGMALAMFATLNPGDEVIVFSPYFSAYKGQITLAGGTLVEVPTYEADGFAIREECLRAALTDRTRGIIINSPNNPTGAVYPMETLEMLARVAVERDLILYADDIYTHYVYTGKMIPIMTLPGMAERTITFNSFSKNYMMTGWRVGYIIAQPHFIETMLRINYSVIYSAPSVSQRAALMALSLTDSIRKTYLADYQRRVFYAAERIGRIPWMHVLPPQGTFYLFPNIEKTGLNSADFCDTLFERAHILVTPGSVFGAAGEGHFRLVCTAKQEALSEAFDRMEQLDW